MQDIQSQIKQLKRPGLLVRAARFGLDGYRRDRDLARLLPEHGTTGPGAALMEAERDENEARLAHAAYYAIVRHIDLLTAIMAEARDLEEIARPRLVP
ncbi:DUF6477 family protein [Loktanella sp. DJP18]|uniref:DUF6477 family protein n=1 Tax=Loktanella sp. DJP18 TaxID=3409788 RepID=UPI003BB69A1A